MNDIKQRAPRGSHIEALKKWLISSIERTKSENNRLQGWGLEAQAAALHNLQVELESTLDQVNLVPADFKPTTKPTGTSSAPSPLKVGDTVYLSGAAKWVFEGIPEITSMTPFTITEVTGNRKYLVVDPTSNRGFSMDRIQLRLTPSTPTAI